MFKYNLNITYFAVGLDGGPEEGLLLLGALEVLAGLFCPIRNFL